jgi:hypothetical protein
MPSQQEIDDAVAAFRDRLNTHKGNDRHISSVVGEAALSLQQELSGSASEPSTAALAESIRAQVAKERAPAANDRKLPNGRTL